MLQLVSRNAFTHPIHAIVFVALLASTSYVGLLEGSLFDRASVGNDVGGMDLNSLVEGGRRLQLGEQTSWKWQTDNGGFDDVGTVCGDHEMACELTDASPECSAHYGDDFGLS